MKFENKLSQKKLEFIRKVMDETSLTPTVTRGWPMVADSTTR